MTGIEKDLTWEKCIEILDLCEWENYKRNNSSCNFEIYVSDNFRKIYNLWTEAFKLFIGGDFSDVKFLPRAYVASRKAGEFCNKFMDDFCLAADIKTEICEQYKFKVLN